MIITRVLAMCLLAAVCLAASAGVVADKLTVDPNAAVTRPDVQESETLDARLQQRVTYSASGRMVQQVLDDLSRLTGVLLKSGYNNSDWQVRERRMNVFVKDMPLAHLMNSIARVMKFKWLITERSGVRTYRLIMDRRVLVSTERDVMRKIEEFKRAEVGKRARWVEDFKKLPELSPAELAKLKEENPHMYAYMAGGAGDAIAAMLRVCPEVTDRLIAGEEGFLSLDMLPVEAHRPVLAALEAMRQYWTKLEGKDLEFTGDPEAQWKEVHIMINGRLNNVRRDFLGGVQGWPYMIGDLGLCFANYGFPIEMADPASGLGKAAGKTFLDTFDGGKSHKDAWKDNQTQLESGRQGDVKALDFGEPAADHPDEPALHEKIKMKVDEPKLEKALEAFANASGLSVVSDSFGRSLGSAGFAGAELEVAQALERIASGYHYNWWKRGPIVEFRDRNWFLKRSTQIPEAWMESWRSAFKKTGTLDLDMLAQIAAMEWDQFNANVRYDEVLGQRDLFLVWLYNGRILRLYASLDDAQRAMVFTERGLSFDGLTPEQFAKAREAMKYCVKFRADPSVPARLTGNRTQKGKLYEYSFHGYVVGDVCSAWQFTTPEYKPPAPAQPQPAAK